MRIAEVMTPDVEFVDAATSIQDAAITMGELSVGALPIETALDLMGARNVRRLPVLDTDGRMVGIVTLSDLSRVLLLSSGVIKQALHDLTPVPV